MPNKVWDEITYPFPYLNGYSILERIGNFTPHFKTM